MQFAKSYVNNPNYKLFKTYEEMLGNGSIWFIKELIDDLNEVFNKFYFSNYFIKDKSQKDKPKITSYQVVLNQKKHS